MRFFAKSFYTMIINIIIMEKRIEVIVEGVVQGVGFRYFTKRVARAFGIKGYVKNLPDGRVYIVAEGDTNVLEKFLASIRRGPSLAIVKNIIVSEKEPTGEFEDFTILY